MAFGGLLGDHQRIGDCAIAVAARNQGDHSALARGKAVGIDEFAARGGRRWFVHCCTDHAQKLLAQFVVGDRGGQRDNHGAGRGQRVLGFCVTP